MNLSSYLSNRKYVRTVEHLSRVLIKKFKLTMIVVIAYIINFFCADNTFTWYHWFISLYRSKSGFPHITLCGSVMGCWINLRHFRLS